VIAVALPPPPNQQGRSNHTVCHSSAPRPQRRGRTCHQLQSSSPFRRVPAYVRGRSRPDRRTSTNSPGRASGLRRRVRRTSRTPMGPERKRKSWSQLADQQDIPHRRPSHRAPTRSASWTARPSVRTPPAQPKGPLAQSSFGYRSRSYFPNHPPTGRLFTGLIAIPIIGADYRRNRHVGALVSRPRALTEGRTGRTRSAVCAVLADSVRRRIVRRSFRSGRVPAQRRISSATAAVLIQPRPRHSRPARAIELVMVPRAETGTPDTMPRRPIT